MGMLVRSWVIVGLVLGGCGAGNGEEPAQTRSRATVVDMDEYRYDIVDVALPPADYTFQPIGLTSSRELIGYGFACPEGASSCVTDLVKTDLEGHFTVVTHDFFAFGVGDRGDVWGCLGRQDGETHTCDTAVVRADGRIDVFLPGPCESSEGILAMSDGGTLLLSAFPQAGPDCPAPNTARTDYVVIDGERHPVDIGDSWPTAINDRGDMTGPYAAGGAFRYDAKTGTVHSLTSGSCDTAIQVMAINQAGVVLGIASPWPGARLIGTWDETNEFSLVLSENTPDFPVWSTGLTWNDRGLIVVYATNDGHTYLIPKGRERLDLASLVDSGEVPPRLLVIDVNERGDLLGLDLDTQRYLVIVRRE